MDQQLIDAYEAALKAVRVYTTLVQAQPTEHRPAFLLLAEDLTDATGDTCECLITGSAPQLFELLANAGEDVPRLGCAIVVSAERETMKQVALNYFTERSAASSK